MKQKIETFLLVGVILGVLGFFAILGQSTHWADSELWTISVARTFSWLATDSATNYKFLFEWLLNQIYFFDLDNLSTLLFARAIFTVVGLGVVLFTFLISREVGLSKKVSLWSVLLLISTSFFLSQGFRVRSDILATLCQLIALFCYLKIAKSDKKLYRFWFLGWVLFQFLMLLCTPKAIYQFTLNLIVIGFDQGVEGGVKGLKRNFSSVGSRIGLALLIFVLDRWSHFHSAIQFYLSSFFESASHPGYFSKESFFYVSRFVTENVLFLVILCLTFVLGQRQFRKMKKRPRAIFISALVALIFLSLHNDRLPFFILSLLPLVCVMMAMCFAKILEGEKEAEWKGVVRIALIFALLIHSWTFFYRFWSLDNNRIQRAAIVEMVLYLSETKPKLYFDPTAVLPRTTPVFLNVETSSPKMLQDIMSLIEDNQPELVFFGNRFFYYSGEILNFLDHHDYIHVGGGVYARAKVIYNPKHSGLDMKTLCAQNNFSNPHVYVGNQFIKMTQVEDVDSLKKEIPADLVACTNFKPFQFPSGKSFAEIFDYDKQF